MDPRHLQAVYANLPVGVVVVDGDCLVVEVNRHAEQLLDLRPGQDLFGSGADERWPLLSTDGSALLPADSPIARVLGGQEAVAHGEVGVDLGDEEPLWLRLTAAKLPAIDGGGAVLVLEDVTEVHRAEARRRSWQALLETTREHLAMACDAADVTLWRYDHEARTTDVVRGGRVYVDAGIDLSRGSFRPTEIVERMLDDGRDDYLRATTQARTEGESYECTFGIVDASGRTRWLLERGQPDEENPDIVLGATLDVTEQVEQERRRRIAEDRLDKVLAAAPDVISLANPDGSLQYVSPSVEQVLGRDADALVGQLEPGLVAAEAIDDASQDAIVQERSKVEGPDGDDIWVETVTAAVTDEDGNRELVSVTRDVTVEVEAFEEVQRLRAAAEQATRSKSSFLANMSHEIRTPMNAIIGMSRLALETELTPRQRRYLERVHQSGESLLCVINDLLDYSKIEAGKMELEDVEFRLDDVLDSFRTAIGLDAVGRGVELLFDIASDVPLGLRGDPLRLGQVLCNLGSNAVKFTEDGGEVVLDVVAEARGSGRVDVRFTVHDTGIGMTAEQLERLFLPFEQADLSTTRTFGGTGLGLTIASDLVTRMGGRITVESTPGVGTCFDVVVPFVVTDGEHGVYGEEIPGDHPARVLVVDDRPTAREIHARMIERMGLRVDQARDGHDALEMIAAAGDAPYDLLLVDWRMPRLDGVELVRQLGTDGTAPPPAVVMVTAYDRVEAQEAAQDLDIRDFIEKPATPSMLHDSILAALGHEVLRRGRSRGQARHEIRELVASLEGAHLLLVEDNKINQELAVELLEREGLRVTLARDGEQALAALEEQRFDGVLMDCQMPVMDGYEATRRLRQRPELEHLPVIAMTANARDTDREEVLAAGMDDHIAKPLDIREMWETLARWIHRTGHVGWAESAPRPTAAQTLTVAPDPTPSPAPAPAPRIEIDGVDTVRGLHVCRGDASLYRRLLDMLVEHHADAAERIRAALEDRDLATAQYEAHALRGVTANIQAAEVTSLAAEIETACEVGDRDTAIDRVAVLEVTFGAILDQVRALPAPTASTAPDADAEELLERLAGLLDRHDPEATRIVDGLEDVLGSSSSVRQQVRGLRDAVRIYDFEAGQARLRLLREQLGRRAG